MLKSIVFLIVFLLVYKLVSNGFYYFRTTRFKKKYLNWLLFDENIPITTYKPLFKSIMRRANIENLKIPMAQAVGYGQIATGMVSITENFPNRYEDHATVTTRLLDEAIGVFKQRIFEAFNPLYWIDSILFLPRTILSYLGMKPENVLIKFFNVIWWILAPLAVIFRGRFISYISDLFQ